MSEPSHQIPVSPRASCIEYAIRDVVVPAMALEKQGHSIIKLNIGDPLAYPGLPTPQHMLEAFKDSLDRQENGYGPSYGVQSLREAIAVDEQNKMNGGWNCTPDDVYVTAGVTEALQIIFAATLTHGDKVLAPGPHYPPYMAYPPLFDATTVEYGMVEEDGWSVDLEDIKAKMDENVKLLVVINPNNPTGGAYSKEILEEVIEIAAGYPDCIILSDEIYDGLNFTDSHYSTASLSTDVPVIALNGVSKVYYAPGWRIGYMALHDPNGRMALVRDGMERLLRSRLCAPTPQQHGYLAGLIGSKEWMDEYRERLLAQRELCMKRIGEIDGLEATSPGGAFYLFVRLTDPIWAQDDKAFVLKLLEEEHVLAVHGSGFSEEYGKGHFRMVFLPRIDILDEAFNRIDRFLKRHRQS